jgi:hypothetical protein
MGVLQSTVAELVTVKEHRRESNHHNTGLGSAITECIAARAYTLMPVVWCLG